MNSKHVESSKIFTCAVCQKSFGQRQHLNRHMHTHEEAKYVCACGKSFVRMDVLRKHKKSCYKNPANETTCRLCDAKFTQKCHLIRHEKKCKIKQTHTEIKKRSKEYDEKIEHGSIVYQILQKDPDTKEAALDFGDKQCLKLYQESVQVGLDMNQVVLKPWQKEVIEFIDHPCDRVVYWIIGSQGAEGKTFLQKHIEQQYGARRVFKGELNAKNSDIGYVMSKQPLTCKDIFLFNMRRSDTESAYGVLESLKDGFFLCTKYHSNTLKIKTPNCVFSNSHPTTTQLSSDRWKIYEIVADQLRKKSMY